MIEPNLWNETKALWLAVRGLSVLLAHWGLGMVALSCDVAQQKVMFDGLWVLVTAGPVDG